MSEYHGEVFRTVSSVKNEEIDAMSRSTEVEWYSVSLGHFIYQVEQGGGFFHRLRKNGKWAISAGAPDGMYLHMLVAGGSGFLERVGLVLEDYRKSGEPPYIVGLFVFSGREEEGAQGEKPGMPPRKSPRTSRTKGRNHRVWEPPISRRVAAETGRAVCPGQRHERLPWSGDSPDFGPGGRRVSPLSA